MPAHRISRPLFARFYARVSPAMDAGGIAARRQQLLAGLTGTVIEIGAGNGLNFAYYPAGVTRVLAIEPDPFLRRIAHRNAASAPVPVEVTDGVAEELPAGDATFDAAVSAFVLCTVASQQTVLREIHRVVRPGGQLRLLEHVRPRLPRVASGAAPARHDHLACCLRCRPHRPRHRRGGPGGRVHDR